MTHEHYSKITEKIEQLFLDDTYDVVQVGFGEKEKNGEFLPEKCIKFGVVAKKPISEIPPDKLIPPTIEIDGIVYKTDVYIAPEKLFASPAYCNNTGDNEVPPNVSPPVSYNRAYSRPLSGGISFGVKPPTGFVSTGTLGGIVVDMFDGKMVGLTNNHVGAVPGGNLEEADLPQFYANDATYRSTFSAYSDIRCYQPSSWDRGVSSYNPDYVGSKKRVVPFTSTGLNKVDAAIINLTDSAVGNTSWAQISGSFSSAPDFATTSEINSITTSDPVFKSGRTTGPVGQGPCQLRITNTNTAVSVDFGNAGTIDFTQVMLIQSPVTDTVTGSGGDSGSLVYTLFNSGNVSTSAWKVVGLYFAGNGTGSLGVACRIDNVSNLLAVSAYKGDFVSATPSVSSYITLPYNTYGGTISAEFYGKKYWQVGKF